MVNYNAARRPPLLGLTEQQEAADRVAGPVQRPGVRPARRARTQLPRPDSIQGVGSGGTAAAPFLFAGQLQAVRRGA